MNIEKLEVKILMDIEKLKNASEMAGVETIDLEVVENLQRNLVALKKRRAAMNTIMGIVGVAKYEN